jgi:hypothetical protein
MVLIDPELERIQLHEYFGSFGATQGHFLFLPAEKR